MRVNIYTYMIYMYICIYAYTSYHGQAGIAVDYIWVSENLKVWEGVCVREYIYIYIYIYIYMHIYIISWPCGDGG